MSSQNKVTHIIDRPGLTIREELDPEYAMEVGLEMVKDAADHLDDDEVRRKLNREERVVRA